MIFVPQEKPKFFKRPAFIVVILASFVVIVGLIYGLVYRFQPVKNTRNSESDETATTVTPVLEKDVLGVQDSPGEFSLDFNKTENTWNIMLGTTLVKSLPVELDSCFVPPDPVVDQSGSRVLYVDGRDVVSLDFAMEEKVLFTLPDLYKVIGSFYVNDTEIGALLFDRKPQPYASYNSNPRLKATQSLSLDNAITRQDISGGYEVLKYFDDNTVILSNENYCGPENGTKYFKIVHRKTLQNVKTYMGATFAGQDRKNIYALIKGQGTAGSSYMKLVSINTMTYEETILREVQSGSISLQKADETHLYFLYKDGDGNSINSSQGVFEVALRK